MTEKPQNAHASVTTIPSSGGRSRFATSAAEFCFSLSESSMWVWGWLPGKSAAGCSLKKKEWPEYGLVFLLRLPPVGKACAQLSQTPYQSHGRRLEEHNRLESSCFPFRVEPVTHSTSIYASSFSVVQPTLVLGLLAVSDPELKRRVGLVGRLHVSKRLLDSTNITVLLVGVIFTCLCPLAIWFAYILPFYNIQCLECDSVCWPDSKVSIITNQ